MAYIGPEPNPGQNREVDDISSSFNGSTTAFTLQVNSQNVSPGSSNAIIVSLGGVVQNPGTDYTVAASTLTFTTAPASGLSFFGLVLGQQVDTEGFADGGTLNNPIITGDLSIADKIVHTGDTNTAIRFPAADTVSVETGGSQRLGIDSSGKLLGGNYFTSQQIGAVTAPVQVQGTSADTSALSLFRYSNDTGGSKITLGKGRGTSGGAADKPQDNDTVGTIHFHVANNNDLVNGNVAAIDVQMDGAPGGGDTPGRMRFLTSPDGSSTLSERMRIRNDGLVMIATTSALINESGLSVRSGGNTCVLKAEGAAGHNPLICWNTNETGTRQQIQFGDGASFGSRGSITTNGGNVSYGGTSDYRRKQDDVSITDGIEKVKLLKPKRFKWKDALDLGICDGFFAHEVQAVAPTSQAVTGTKDEVDSDGNPVYQQMDQSKLVPLLTAALQEAITKIETLETKVAALEAA